MDVRQWRRSTRGPAEIACGQEVPLQERLSTGVRIGAVKRPRAVTISTATYPATALDASHKPTRDAAVLRRVPPSRASAYDDYP